MLTGNELVGIRRALWGWGGLGGATLQPACAEGPPHARQRGEASRCLQRDKEDEVIWVWGPYLGPLSEDKGHLPSSSLEISKYGADTPIPELMERK